MTVSVFSAISPKDWDEPAWNDAVSVLKKYHVSRFILCPQHWSEYSNIVLTWRKVQFTAKGVARLPDDKPGLYTFIVQPNVGGHTAIKFLLYIGETTKQSLRDRCADYLPEARKKKARVPIRSMVRKWPDHLWIYFAAVEEPSVIKQLEEDLIKAYLPPFNQQFTAHVGKAGKLSNLLKEVFQ
jgi:excinuclease UvrABC nuclease subunit